jgi:bromodomain-containing factor 1
MDGLSPLERPKRETHTPDTLVYTPTVKKPANKQAASDLKYGLSILREFKSKYYQISYPFLTPVDPVALGIPTYPLIIKNPMDFGTVMKKLESSMYLEGSEFEEDVRLVFNNCFTFNPPLTDVYEMGRKLQNIFDVKWSARPLVPVPAPLSTSMSLAGSSKSKSVLVKQSSLRLDSPFSAKPSPSGIYPKESSFHKSSKSKKDKHKRDDDESSEEEQGIFFCFVF